jgi:hypothetical protein
VQSAANQQTRLDEQGIKRDQGNGARAGDTQAGQEARGDWHANEETKALNLLEAQGLARFCDFRPIGNDIYAANVLQYGHGMTVDVNPLTNQITRG